MDANDVDAGLKRLDQLAHEEYGTDFAQAIATPDEELNVRRMARLAGIELKHPFARSQKISGRSETDARQEWIFKQELLTPDGTGALPLDALKGNPSYDLELRIFEELKSQGDSFTTGMSFGDFLENNHSESNWFLAALRAAQPYLCEDSGISLKEPPPKEKRSRFWEIVRLAADDFANRGVEKAIEPVAASLGYLVPFMVGAPPAVAAGLSVFIVHFAKRAYCAAEIQQEIVTTLKLKSYEWERK